VVKLLGIWTALTVRALKDRDKMDLEIPAFATEWDPSSGTEYAFTIRRIWQNQNMYFTMVARM
jgi:hypothetical protein